MLSLSIVPAQKAADVFSSAILKLYARDRTTLGVFVLLSCTSLLSLLLGTNWTFEIGARYTLAAQFIILGLSLDALRAFYIRALDLLVPSTALDLVSKECNGYINRARREVDRLVRIYEIAGAPSGDSPVARWAFYSKSQISRPLIAWVTQLEEFAHKGITRRDTLAVNEIVAAMAAIGKRYAESRRDSFVLVPDVANPFAMSTSDISHVLNPIYESIKKLCEDAVKHSNEAVVRGCINTLGDMATHAMTMVSPHDPSRSTPLAFSAAFYMDLSAQQAIKAGMGDAMLAAIGSAQRIFAQVSLDTNTREVESKLLECLLSIAIAFYVKGEHAICFKPIEMMLLAAQHDLRIRGFRDTAILIRTLQNIAFLLPLEIAIDKVGQRLMESFPPYSMAFKANLPALLAEVAKKVKAVDQEQWTPDPFHDFSKVSEEIWRHYHDIADKVDFDGSLLQRWALDSIINVADVHIHLLANPPTGSASFLGTVEDRLLWFIHAPSLFFRENGTFPPDHAAIAAGHLAILGMRLLKLQRLKSAAECGKAITAIGSRCTLAHKKPSYTAKVMIMLEQLRRAANALGYTQLITWHASSEEVSPELQEVMRHYISELDKVLKENERGLFPSPHDPMPLLRRILEECHAPPKTH